LSGTKLYHLHGHHLILVLGAYDDVSVIVVESWVLAVMLSEFQ